MLPLKPLLCVVVACAALTAAASPTIELLGKAHAWSPAQFRITGLPAAENPFDPEEIRVDATFTSPSGAKITLPAFWFQDYTRHLESGAEKLEPSGEPHWRIRFSATEPGTHHVELAVRNRGTEASGGELDFKVAPASPGAPRGWVRVAKDGRTFATSDGRPLLFAGHNVCWPGAGGTFTYDALFAEMAAAGQNFARLWLSPWWAPIEHLPGTLNNYRLDAAWQLDGIFEAAERHGIYLLLCMDHHGMYQPVDPTWGGSNAFWRSNPYSVEQGGPCARAADFFALPEARVIYQKRLRYLIGRYSAHPLLVSWQFFNEIDNVFDRAPVAESTVVDWHVEMARWLRANDPYRHVIGTSMTGGVDRPAFWNLPEIEYTVYHAYWEPAPVRRVAALAADFTRRYGKPAMIGEFGVNGGHWDAPADPHLRGFRQHLWAGALGGSATTALSWWWEDLHRDGGLQLEHVVTNFLRKGGWFEGGWEPLAIDASPEPPKTLAAPLPGKAAFTETLALNPFWRLRLDNQFAVATPLAARRASEHLSAVLWGTRVPEAQRPLHLTVWAGSNARVVVRTQSAQGPAEVVAHVDGREVAREAIAGAGPVDRELVLQLEPGLREIELSNPGVDRVQLASIRVENLQPAEWPGDWRYRAEAIGLRKGNRAMLYVVSPAAVYPAGAIPYQLPAFEGERLSLPGWPDGTYRVQWVNTETGELVTETEGTAAGGTLVIPVPPLHVESAAYVE